MTDIAISVQNLSKMYRIGRQQARYKRFTETVMETVLASVRRLRDLRKPLPATETLWALKNVSFDVKEGEVVGIIGRNGAGKSTLLKVLSRITEPTEGEVRIRGRIGSLLEVGTGFHPELTGRENIYLNGAILGMHRAEINRKFDEIVAFAEVEKFLDTPVKRYSSGMYVRLAFAVAAHLEPEILVVDEVLAVGDAQFQKKCMGKMEDVAKGGRTVFFVSHNMSAITSLCSRAILLDHGEMINDDISKNVVASYLATSSGASAVAEWSGTSYSPGTDGFELNSVKLVDSSDQPVSVVNIEQPLMVKVRYRTSVSGLKFRCAIGLYTQGVCSFYTVEPTELVREAPTWYESIVRIPGNLLAEGEYLVHLSVFASRGKKSHLCSIKDVIAFQVFDPMSGNSARGDYAEGLAGVMRPLLEWQTRLVEVH